jgi:hypothetical protein
MGAKFETKKLGEERNKRFRQSGVNGRAKTAMLKRAVNGPVGRPFGTYKKMDLGHPDPAMNRWANIERPYWSFLNG